MTHSEPAHAYTIMAKALRDASEEPSPLTQTIGEYIRNEAFRIMSRALDTEAARLRLLLRNPPPTEDNDIPPLETRADWGNPNPRTDMRT